MTQKDSQQDDDPGATGPPDSEVEQPVVTPPVPAAQDNPEPRSWGGDDEIPDEAGPDVPLEPAHEAATPQAPPVESARNDDDGHVAERRGSDDDTGDPEPQSEAETRRDDNVAPHAVTVERDDSHDGMVATSEAAVEPADTTAHGLVVEAEPAAEPADAPRVTLEPHVTHVFDTHAETTRDPQPRAAYEGFESSTPPAGIAEMPPPVDVTHGGSAELDAVAPIERFHTWQSDMVDVAAAATALPAEPVALSSAEAPPLHDDPRPADEAAHAREIDVETPVIVRTAWDKPPPLATHPSWMVREIAPDIILPPDDPTPLNPGSAWPTPTDRTMGDEAAYADAAQDVASTAVTTPSAVPVSTDPQPHPETDAEPEPEPDFAGWRDEVVALRARDPDWPAPGVSPDEPPLVLNETRAGHDVLPPAARRSDAHEAESLDASIEGPPLADVSPPSLAQPQRIAEPPWQAPPVLPMFRPAPAAAADAVAYDDFDGAPPSRWDHAKDLGRTALRYAGYAVAGYFAFVFVLILLYRVINPPFSSLMAVQALTGTDVQQEWVALEEISPALVRAVIVSEDWSFCEHYGIDIKAIEDAIERSGNGIPRGASTISMQTTKNLFLWNAKSYVRKAVEVPLTLMIELVWPKSRILEVYLNVAEWGPGIFGAEAAAQYHFNKPASRLGEREAAQLAASLPNPIIREAGDPGPRTARKASVIQSRMRNAGGAAECVLGGRR